MAETCFYLDVECVSRVAAGPLSITGVYLKHLPITKHAELDDEYLEQLFEDSDNKFVQEYLWPEELELYKTKKIASKMMFVIAQLHFKTKQYPSVIYTPHFDMPCLTAHPREIKPHALGCAVAKAINASRRRTLISKHYSRLYPEFHLDRNLGMVTREHYQLLAEYGPRQNLHHRSFVQALPNYLANQVLSLNKLYLSTQLKPRWWSELDYGDFFDYIHPTNKQAIEYLLGKEAGAQEFQEFIQNHQPADYRSLVKDIERSKRVYDTCIKKRRAEKKYDNLRRKAFRNLAKTRLLAVERE
jgi:ribonuclease HII